MVGDTPGVASGRCAPSTSLESVWEASWLGVKDPRENIWTRTVFPFLSGVDYHRRLERTRGIDCVTAVQCHRGNLSSGSERATAGTSGDSGLKLIHQHNPSYFNISEGDQPGLCK